MKIKINMKLKSKDYNYDSNKSIFENLKLEEITLKELTFVLRKIIFWDQKKYLYLLLERIFGVISYFAFILIICDLFIIYSNLFESFQNCFIIALIVLFILAVGPWFFWFIKYRDVSKFNINLINDVKKVLKIEDSKYDKLRNIIINNIREEISRNNKLSTFFVKGFSMIFSILGTLLVSMGTSMFSTCCNCCEFVQRNNYEAGCIILAGLLILFISIFVFFKTQLIKSGFIFYSEEILKAYEQAVFEEEI